MPFLLPLRSQTLRRQNRLLTYLLSGLGWWIPVQATAQAAAKIPVEIMVVGFDHLNQLYANTPQSDVLSPHKQTELAQLRARLRRFQPTSILLEAEPKEQAQLDSLYAAYQRGQLAFTTLPAGRSERYQVGFALANELHLPAPQGIDYYESTSQSLLSTGHNIAAFRQGLLELQQTARPLKRLVQHDSLSIYDYIALANQPAFIALAHRALFNTPALVTSGTFSTSATNTVSLGQVDTAYIGAHYITLFYNRNLKIYSNILRAQQQSHSQRLLILLGLAHVGVQEELLAANPAYRVVHAATYLKLSAEGRALLKKRASTRAF